jgi:hypothetical protein
MDGLSAVRIDTHRKTNRPANLDTNPTTGADRLHPPLALT